MNPSLRAFRVHRSAIADRAEAAYRAWESCPSHDSQRAALLKRYRLWDTLFQFVVKEERLLCASLGADDHFGRGKGPWWAAQSDPKR